MSYDVKYIGMDVHKEAIVIAVQNASGKLVMESVIETKASSILQFLHGLRGELHVTWEEGTWAAWLYDLLQPQVQHIVVCNPRRNALLKEGNKSDKVDARQAGRFVTHRDAETGLPRGKWTADATRVGAQLSDHQQRFDARDESIEGAVSRLGHSLCRHPGLCCARSGGMVKQAPTSRRAPPRGAALSTAGRIAGLAGRGATRVFGGEPETQGRETAASDSLHRSGSSGALDRADANPAPVSQQAATMDLQWPGR